MLDCKDNTNIESLSKSYRDKNREVKRCARRAKRKRIEDNARITALDGKWETNWMT